MSNQAAPPSTTTTKVEMPVPQTQPQPVTPMTSQPQAQRATTGPNPQPPEYRLGGASFSGVYYDYGTPSLSLSLFLPRQHTDG